MSSTRSRSKKRYRSESSSSERDGTSQSKNGFARILKRIECRLDTLEQGNKRYKKRPPRSPSFSSEEYSTVSSGASDVVHDSHRSAQDSK